MWTRALRARLRVADLFVPIRAGTDIAFLGGLINYVLTHERWFKEYVLAYTNASTIVEEGFQDTEELDGVFSGYDPKQREYQSVKGTLGLRKIRTAQTKRRRNSSANSRSRQRQAKWAETSSG